MAKLKPVLKTRKLNSLPSDLKSIAEELIIAKFGDEAVVKKVVKKEVKRAKSSSSFPGFDEFRQEYTVGFDMGRESVTTVDERFVGSSISALHEMVAATRREPGVDRRIDFHSRSSYFVTPITRADTRAFRDAIQRLDYENAPNHKRRASVSPDFARELLNHPDFRYFAGYRDDRYRGYRYGNYIGELFGVPIFAVEGVHPEIIAEG
jgi:hypothetical protein